MVRNKQRRKIDIPKWGKYLRGRWREPYKDGDMDYSDMYVMDWEENWTFVMTHETDCGPYFIQKHKTSES
ncbi:DUF4275 family protein [Bacillus sp. A015]